MSVSPPGGFGAPEPDPLRSLRRTRNIIIAVIAGVAILILIGSCGYNAFKQNNARQYVTSNYQRDASLDESGVQAYIADGTPSKVADEISDAENPNDRREGDAAAAGAVAGSLFMQYPDYLIGLFPYGNDKTRVMVSRDYRSGYNHYHNYVGGYWVPTPNFGGNGSDNRGGGSNGGGK
ncbi:DUF4247 domain-containing protein [Gordonia sp. NPDC003585]|uniref:DUF4247 domain-containing protein n=1 Tax=Gordonia sp. NPDC003585 TaxID=3154275 RepID=UPI0033BEED65